MVAAIEIKVTENNEEEAGYKKQCYPFRISTH